MSVRCKKQIKKVVDFYNECEAETTKKFLENYPDFQTDADKVHEIIGHIELKCDGNKLIIRAWPEYEKELDFLADVAKDAPGAEGWDDMPY